MKRCNIGYDLSYNALKYINLTVDISNNIILPDGFSRDQSTNAMLNILGNPVEYRILRYDVDGNPMVFQPITIDPANNPILPNNYIIDNTRAIREQTGAHIVIVTV